MNVKNQRIVNALEQAEVDFPDKSEEFTFETTLQRLGDEGYNYSACDIAEALNAKQKEQNEH